jgi:hypothetical protein
MTAIATLTTETMLRTSAMVSGAAERPPEYRIDMG